MGPKESSFQSFQDVSTRETPWPRPSRASTKSNRCWSSAWSDAPVAVHLRLGVAHLGPNLSLLLLVAMQGVPSSFLPPSLYLFIFIILAYLENANLLDLKVAPGEPLESVATTGTLEHISVRSQWFTFWVWYAANNYREYVHIYICRYSSM